MSDLPWMAHLSNHVASVASHQQPRPARTRQPADVALSAEVTRANTHWHCTAAKDPAFRRNRAGSATSQLTTQLHKRSLRASVRFLLRGRRRGQKSRSKKFFAPCNPFHPPTKSRDYREIKTQCSQNKKTPKILPRVGVKIRPAMRRCRPHKPSHSNLQRLFC